MGQSSVGADSLEISHAEDAFQLGLIDDGCGIGSVPRRSGSIGLFSMTERAREIGATLDIAGRPEGGTALRLRLPLVADGGKAQP